jgi:hypothetical protein
MLQGTNISVRALLADFVISSFRVCTPELLLLHRLLFDRCGTPLWVVPPVAPPQTTPTAVVRWIAGLLGAVVVRRDDSRTVIILGGPLTSPTTRLVLASPSIAAANTLLLLWILLKFLSDLLPPSPPPPSPLPTNRIVVVFGKKQNNDGTNSHTPHVSGDEPRPARYSCIDPQLGSNRLTIKKRRRGAKKFGRAVCAKTTINKRRLCRSEKILNHHRFTIVPPGCWCRWQFFPCLPFRFDRASGGNTQRRKGPSILARKPGHYKTPVRIPRRGRRCGSPSLLPIVILRLCESFFVAHGVFVIIVR